MSFKATFIELASNGLMNERVADAVESDADAKAIEKEIKLAIRMHGKWIRQPGSSHLHVAVQAGLYRLLDALRAELRDTRDEHDPTL
jgi:hypothetical protein